MPRKLLLRTDSVPYHVTARTNNREDFPLALEKIWTLIGSECLKLTLVYGVEFHATVLMPNHIHMILTVPEHDLGKVMNVFMSSLTRTINLLSGRSGHLFGGPYHWSLINSARYFGHALKYVYRNPVRAKLCDQVQDYPFNTLHGQIGQSHLPFPIFFTRVSMELALPSIESPELLKWLNQPFPIEAEAMIKRGLKKKHFRAGRDRNTRKPCELLNLFL